MEISLHLVKAKLRSGLVHRQPSNIPRLLRGRLDGISLALVAIRADSQKRLIVFLILREEGVPFESAYTPVVLAP